MTTIRLLRQPEEIASLARLHAQSRRTTYTGILSPQALDRINDEEAETDWRARLAEPVLGRVVLVAVHLGELGGFAMVTRDDEDLATLNALHVRADLHGAGHGTQLLAATVSVARGWGCRRLQLFVVTQNATARAFYTQRGWVDDGFRRDHVIAREALQVARYVRDVTKPACLGVFAVGATHARTPWRQP